MRKVTAYFWSGNDVRLGLRFGMYNCTYDIYMDLFTGSQSSGFEISVHRGKYNNVGKGGGANVVYHEYFAVILLVVYSV